MELKGRNILITGGTSGVGRALVRQLHSDNTVAVVARDRRRLQQLATEFPGVRTFSADLSRPADVDAVALWAVAAGTRLDLLINNAAVQNVTWLTDPDFRTASIAHEVAVNFTALCALTALLLPALRHGGPAAVLNVNSALALAPKTDSAVYCATKAAVDSFSQSLRYQLQGTPVRVLQAFLPLVDTPMTAGRGDGKLTAEDAAGGIIRGIENDVADNDIGRARVVRRLWRLSPRLARRVMKAA